jgi:hypothetical protein
VGEGELLLDDPDVPDRKLAVEGAHEVVVRDRLPGVGGGWDRDRLQDVTCDEVAAGVEVEGGRFGHGPPPSWLWELSEGEIPPRQGVA